MAATSAMQCKQSVLFIDSGVADYQILAGGAEPGTEVHVLDARQDGLTQIAQTLNGRYGIDAIHIISHGAAGKLLIGSTPLTGANLQDYSGELAILGDALAPDGDILLYGCHVGAGAQGTAFVAALADATGANVAASRNPVGAVVLGGDWQLEIHAGAVRSSLALTDATVNSYGHLFAVETFNTNPLTGTPSTFTLNGFTYTISGGDGGSFTWYSTNGVSSTGNLAPQSTTSNGTTTETVTITYTGNAAFLFNSMAVYFSTGSYTYTFTGKLGGSTVATATSAAGANAFQTISFGSATAIDQLVITSVDFHPTQEGMDNFDYTLNSTPSITAGGTTAFTEQTPVVITSAITVNDSNGDADWNGGKLKVQITANNSASDSLTLPTTNGGSIWLDTSGNKLMSNTTQIGTADAASVSSGTAWTFTFNGSATNALVQTTARAVQFTNSSDAPSTTSRTITFTATDKNTASATATQTVTVTAVNDAPALDTAQSPAMTAINEDVADGSNSGTTVATLVVDGSITDADGSAVEAIAVSAADTTNGTWQFKVGAGSWTAFDFTANSGKGLLLDSTDTIRFVPNSNYNGTISSGLTFYAWDKSSGSAGNYLTVSGNTGGSGALSSSSDTASI